VIAAGHGPQCEPSAPRDEASGEMAEERSPCPVKIVYFDCPSGAAATYHGSLLDAACRWTPFLRHRAREAALTGWELVVREVRKGAFRATKVDVEIDHHAHHHHRTRR